MTLPKDETAAVPAKRRRSRKGPLVALALVLAMIPGLVSLGAISAGASSSSGCPTGEPDEVRRIATGKGNKGTYHFNWAYFSDPCADSFRVYGEHGSYVMSPTAGTYAKGLRPGKYWVAAVKDGWGSRWTGFEIK